MDGVPDWKGFYKMLNVDKWVERAKAVVSGKRTTGFEHLEALWPCVSKDPKICIYTIGKVEKDAFRE